MALNPSAKHPHLLPVAPSFNYANAAKKASPEPLLPSTQPLLVPAASHSKSGQASDNNISQMKTPLPPPAQASAPAPAPAPAPVAGTKSAEAGVTKSDTGIAESSAAPSVVAGAVGRQPASEKPTLSTSSAATADVTSTIGVPATIAPEVESFTFGSVVAPVVHASEKPTLLFGPDGAATIAAVQYSTKAENAAPAVAAALPVVDAVHTAAAGKDAAGAHKPPSAHSTPVAHPRKERYEETAPPVPSLSVSDHVAWPAPPSTSSSSSSSSSHTIAVKGASAASASSSAAADASVAVHSFKIINNSDPPGNVSTTGTSGAPWTSKGKSFAEVNY